MIRRPRYTFPIVTTYIVSHQLFSNFECNIRSVKNSFTYIFFSIHFVSKYQFNFYIDVLIVYMYIHLLFVGTHCINCIPPHWLPFVFWHRSIRGIKQCNNNICGPFSSLFHISLLFFCISKGDRRCSSMEVQFAVLATRSARTSSASYLAFVITHLFSYYTWYRIPNCFRFPVHSQIKQYLVSNLLVLNFSFQLSYWQRVK